MKWIWRRLRYYTWFKWRRIYFSWRAKRSIQVLRNLDNVMVRAGWGRTKRRQFWRRFVKTAGERTGLFAEMEKEIGK